MNLKFIKQISEDRLNTRINNISKAGNTSNQVYILEGDKQKFVIKIAGDKNLSHYKNTSINKEADILKTISKQNTLKVPKVLYHDNLDNALKKEFFIMEFISGETLMTQKNQLLKRKKENVQITAELMGYLHSMDMQNFYFINMPSSFTDEIIKNFEEINSLFLNHKDLYNEVNLTKEAISFLKANKPDNEQLSLLHGDFGQDHIILNDKGNYLIDFEPARIGDRSWEIFLMVKELPKSTFGYNEGLNDLIQNYETKFGVLNNKTFFRKATIVASYIQGCYIEKYVPEHRAVPKIKQYRPFFKKLIEEF